jgi:tRNA A-37 threonylcarbamoyl transferase component Bud32
MFHSMSSRIFRDGLRWTARPDVEHDLPERFPDTPQACASDPCARLIRDNNVRMSFFYRTGQAELFVKRYKCRSVWDRLKYFFLPSKAQAEWRNLLLFEQRGIPTSRALAVGERRTLRVLRAGCLVTASLAPAEALGDWLAGKTLDPAQRQQLAKSLGRLVRKLHDGNVFFRDLHAGNILIRWPDGPRPDLFLIDLHKAFSLPGLARWMRARDLGQLCNSLQASRTDRIRFLKVYCKGKPKAFYRGLQRAVAAKQGRLEAVRIKSRSKRCVKQSSVFEVRRTWSVSYFGRKDFGRPAAEAAIALQRTGLAQRPAAVLKQSSKSAVTMHELDGHGSVCVKAYRWLGPWYAIKSLLVPSRPLKCWKAGHGLLVRGLDTPQPLALLQRTWGPVVTESFLITRFLPGAVELNTYVRERLAEDRKKPFIAAFAAMLRSMHHKGIYHGDLKSNNILVQEQGGSWRFLLIDLDRVRFTGDLSFYQRANNLAQINASVAARITVRDRLSFFRIYAKETAPAARRKEYYRRVLEISRTKNTAPYGVLFH